MATNKVRTFSANERDLAMLEAVAKYHGLNKSAMITSLVRKEFWRIFPAGTEKIKPDRGARIEPPAVDTRTAAKRKSEPKKTEEL